MSGNGSTDREPYDQSASTQGSAVQRRRPAVCNGLVRASFHDILLFRMGMLRIVSWLLIVQRRDGCKMTIIDVLGFVFAAACFLILSKFRPAALERRGM